MRTLDKKHLTRKEKWREIIFEADTSDARLFDVILLWVILFSVFIVMLSSVDSIQTHYGSILKIAEWFFTIVFSIEYFLRIYLSPNPRKYILSFWGIIDLLSTIPTYLSLFIFGPQYLLTIRTLRLLRVFRIMQLTSYSREANSLGKAIKASGAKITVFFGAILIVVIIMGTLMFVIEGPENGFSSIPRGIYWAIVTITTVGYGDITPNTILGQVLSSTLMILGYAVITVPTGIVSVEYADQKRNNKEIQPKNGCKNCQTTNDLDAKFCKHCGENLTEN
ncbi:MAG: ion transporter [Flavobacteriales bacterium]|nr:ion transporter [Flavobacteriales bacterium]